MIPKKAPLRKAALLANMEVGAWYTQQDLVEIGGLRFAARLHEVAKEHPTLTYQCRELDSDTGRHEYRLVLRGDSPRPVRRISKLKALEAELEALRKELAGYRNAWARLDGTELELLVSAKPVPMGAR